MTKDAKPDLERKKSMVGIWAGKVIGPEVEARALIEAKLTGHPITKNGLSREIFLWAFEIYCRVGSLAELKKLRMKDLEAPGTEVPPKPGLTAHSQESNAPVNSVEQRAAALLDLLEKAREKPGIKKRKAG